MQATGKQARGRRHLLRRVVLPGILGALTSVVVCSWMLSRDVGNSPEEVRQELHEFRERLTQLEATPRDLVQALPMHLPLRGAAPAPLEMQSTAGAAEPEVPPDPVDLATPPEHGFPFLPLDLLPEALLPRGALIAVEAFDGDRVGLVAALGPDLEPVQLDEASLANLRQFALVSRELFRAEHHALRTLLESGRGVIYPDRAAHSEAMEAIGIERGPGNVVYRVYEFEDGRIGSLDAQELAQDPDVQRFSDEADALLRLAKGDKELVMVGLVGWIQWP